MFVRVFLIEHQKVVYVGKYKYIFLCFFEFKQFIQMQLYFFLGIFFKKNKKLKEKEFFPSIYLLFREKLSSCVPVLECMCVSWLTGVFHPLPLFALIRGVNVECNQQHQQQEKYQAKIVLRERERVSNCYFFAITCRNRRRSGEDMYE